MIVDLYEVDGDRLGVRSGSRPLDVVDRAVRDSAAARRATVASTSAAPKTRMCRPSNRANASDIRVAVCSDAGNQPIEGLCRRLERDEGGVCADNVAFMITDDGDELDEAVAESDVGVSGPEGAQRFSWAGRERGKRRRRHRKAHPSIERDRGIDIANDVADMVQVAHCPA